MRQVMVAFAVLLFPSAAAAQAIETVGTRPAGMSGAFVAVADDASAVYWNPGGLANASIFSLVIDRTQGRTGLSEPAAGSRSGFLIALAAPALGLTYYRLRATALAGPDLAIEPAGPGRNVIRPGEVRLDTLVTHHAGVTLVQSLTDGIAVGATLKMVRGIATGGVVPDANREALLSDSGELAGRGSTKVDADIGVLASAGSLRAGLTVRNVSEPEFKTSGGDTLALQRQARAGVALTPMSGWIVAADFDLLKTRGPFGEGRDAAFGVEGRVARRAFVRGGFRFNTVGDSAEDRAASTSFGGSYAVRAAFLVDAQVTVGSKRSARGWGIGGRFLY
jgi:F plasmid transfer operon protein TraF